MYAVKLYNIWKKYRIDYKRRLSFRDNLLNLFKGFKPNNDFWALKGIDFDIAKGKAVGIIGANGSGKTTLLRLISRITKPTNGSIKVNGRISTLLELGSGFEGDLTGRENIDLNGLILGLSRKEIQRNIDSIIDFADIGDFIDAPVRTYSAGMQLRLGFAIAAHIDSDILLIDEVLSVGDLGFQKKCFKKMNEYKKNNKTLVLVTQDMDLVRQLCNYAIWLNQGEVIKEGETVELTREYEFSMQRSLKKEQKLINLEIEITNVYFLDGQKIQKREFVTGEEMTIRIGYYAHKKIDNPVFGLAVFRADGTHIIGPNTKFSDFKIDSIEGAGKVDFIIDALPFLTGNYKVSVSIHTYTDELDQYDSLDRLFRFSVISGKQKEKYGIISIPHRWEMKN